jgi:hypothetical protein
MIEFVRLELASLWGFRQPHLLQEQRYYQSLFVAFNAFFSIEVEQVHRDDSASNGTQARALKSRDSHLAPGMHKYSTPKAPADES